MIDKQMLPSVTLNSAATPAVASIIWLHGLGADGHDFVPFVEQLGLLEQGVRFILPHAPRMPVTVNGGLSMPAWYDILSADFFSADGASKAREDEQGLRASQARVERLIQQEMDNGIVARHIFLAGFSQGGAVAFQTGLRYPLRLGGILALSTYLPLAASLPKEAHPANADIPVLIMHGQYDEVIPCQAARQAQARLESMGYPVSYHDFPIQHAVCPPQLNRVSAWIAQQLSP